jgi:hypothetical protein
MPRHPPATYALTQSDSGGGRDQHRRFNFRAMHSPHGAWSYKLMQSFSVNWIQPSWCSRWARLLITAGADGKCLALSRWQVYWSFTRLADG